MTTYESRTTLAIIVIGFALIFITGYFLSDYSREKKVIKKKTKTSLMQQDGVEDAEDCNEQYK